MTGHTSDEVIDIPQKNRSTDSESATKTPEIKSGVVQDSPGNPNIGTTNEGMLDDHGNYKKDDDSILDAVDEQTVFDPAVPAGGTGKHGRPTDDSDPGHS